MFEVSSFYPQTGSTVLVGLVRMLAKSDHVKVVVIGQLDGDLGLH